MDDNGDLTPTDRRDVRVFLGGLVAVAVFVVAAKVFTDRVWRAQHWAAGITAVAAAVQAVAVTFALLYAGRQVHVSREVARRRRVEDLLDQLSPLLYEVLPHALSEHRWAVTGMIDDARAFREPENHPVAGVEASVEMLRLARSQSYEQNRAKAEAAYLEVRQAGDRVKRLLAQLGFGQNAAALMLRHEITALGAIHLRRNVDAVIDEPMRVGIERVAKSLKELTSLIDKLAANYAPLDAAERAAL